MDIAKELARRFQGLNRAYGTYELTIKKTLGDGQKITGKPRTIQGEVTHELWQAHVDGKVGLGIVPIMDDSKCFFGAIDIDIYSGLDVDKIIAEIDKQGLPLVPFRSKSGGLHCYAFVKEAVPAKLMQDKLKLFASILGYGDAEIFPKQTELLSERRDTGQWINIPYFDAKKTDRYAYDKNGDPIPIEKFFKHMEIDWFSEADFRSFTITLSSDISDGPPCLQTLITRGFAPGTRNDGLFALAVYLKKKDPDNLESAVDDYNTRYLDPPVSSTEVQNIIKSVKKKDFNYTCSRSPLKNFCNLSVCRNREFGVGGLSGMVQLAGLTKYDSTPPVWFIDIEGGGRLEVATEDLQSQAKFQRKCMEGLNIMPPPMKSSLWQTTIQKLLEVVNIIEAPSDASPKGLFYEYLERFCTSRATARTQDEILMGKPWTNKGQHYFRMSDFMQFLDRYRFKEFKVQKMASMIEEIGGKHKFMNLKGKGTNTWGIPEFAKQTEAFDTPKIEDKGSVL